jgi:hypothetical protein
VIFPEDGFAVLNHIPIVRVSFGKLLQRLVAYILIFDGCRSCQGNKHFNLFQKFEWKNFWSSGYAVDL